MLEFYDLDNAEELRWDYYPVIGNYHPDSPPMPIPRYWPFLAALEERGYQALFVRDSESGELWLRVMEDGEAVDYPILTQALAAELGIDPDGGEGKVIYTPDKKTRLGSIWGFYERWEDRDGFRRKYGESEFPIKFGEVWYRCDCHG